MPPRDFAQREHEVQVASASWSWGRASGACASVQLLASPGSGLWEAASFRGFSFRSARNACGFVQSEYKVSFEVHRVLCISPKLGKTHKDAGQT